jgi:alkaline phosphatase D
MRHLTHGPHIGRLTPTSARIWLRLDGDGHARIRFAPAAHPELAMAVAMDSESARLSEPQQARAKDDYIITCDLADLAPDTTYTYQVEVSDDGAGFTPRAILGTEHGRFSTCPGGDRLTRELVFAFGSCFHPYVCSDRIFDSLAELCEREPGMRFGLWLGDQIYADLMPRELVGDDDEGEQAGTWKTPFHLGFGDSSFREAQDFAAYKRVYRAFWRSLAMRRALMRLPSFRIFDDHEIADDWGIAGENRSSEREEQRVAALRAYELYQHCTNPPTPEGRYWYTFRVADVGFFVLDTRTKRHWEDSERMMLDAEQMAALKEWLDDETLAVKFIASSVPMVHISSIFRMTLPNFLTLTRDQWTGFDDQRRELLQFIFERGIRNVHVLSGDVHISHVARIGNGTEGNHVMSYTSSPMAQESPTLQEYVALKDQSDGYEVDPIFTGAGRNFGLVRVTPPPADDPERGYRVSCELYDRYAERYFVYPGRALIVLDIDRTLSTTNVLERESTPYLNAARVVQRLHQRFGVVYLTARPRFLPYVGMARDWLRNHGFPASQIIMLMKPWDVLPWRHGVYKDEMIAHMIKHQRHTPVIGIGDRKTDAYAYLENGITPLIIADDDEELPDGVRLIHPNAERSIWEQIEDAVFDEIGEAEIERRRAALYG